MIISYGLFVAVFLFIFKPFGMQDLPAGLIIRIAAGYGLATSLAIWLVMESLPALFPKYYKEKWWTTGKELINVSVTFFAVACFNYIFSLIFYKPESFTTIEYLSAGLNILLNTILVGLIPFFFWVLYNQNRLMKKHVEKAEALSRKLQNKQQSKIVSNLQSNHLLFQSSNQKETLNLPKDDFIFAKAEGNYVNIFYEAKGKMKKKLLRTTMKSIEIQTRNSPSLIRCHKSYTVNLDKVSEISGNAQGYTLHFNQYETEIPVSRNKISDLQEKVSV